MKSGIFTIAGYLLLFVAVVLFMFCLFGTLAWGWLVVCLLGVLVCALLEGV